METPESPGTENNTPSPIDEGQKSQLGNFFDFVTKGKKETPEGEPEAKLEEEPLGSSEDEVSLEEGTEEKLEALPVEEAEGEEGEGEEAPSADFASLKAEVAELRALLRQKEEPVEEEPEVPKVEFDPTEFMSEEEAKAFFDNPHEVLTKLAGRIYQKAREDSLRDIPSVVTKATQRQTALTQAQSEFWSKNKDLLEKVESSPAMARLLKITANDLGSQHPDWDIQKIFEETGKEVRSALGLATQAKKVEAAISPSKQPPKPRGKRRPPEADSRSAMQKQIDNMLTSTRR